MNANPKALIDEDRPPAGTPCCVCKSMGHWCQADAWTAGDSGNGICQSCLDGEDCSVMQARKAKAPLFPAKSEPDPAPVRAVVVEKPVPIRLAAPPARTPLASLPHDPNWAAILDRLARLEPGETISLAVPIPFTLRAFEKAILDRLEADPRTGQAKWVHGPDPSGTKLILATEARLGVAKARVGPPKAPVPTALLESIAGAMERMDKPAEQLVSEPLARHSRGVRAGRPRGSLYKSEERERAIELLRLGTPSGAVAKEVGLDRKTIYAISAEIGEQLPKMCRCGSRFGHKGHCSGNSKTSSEIVKSGEVMASLSPAAQGKRLTFKIPEEKRAAILADRKLSAAECARKHGCGISTVYSLRKDAKDKPASAPLAVVTPVSIPAVQLPAVEAPKPAMDMTLSRAFELVMAELNANIETLEDSGDRSKGMVEAIKHDKDIVATLHDYHPAFTGMTATGCAPSVFDRALEQAQSEVHLIELELQRLARRRDALKPVLAALKASQEAERDTR